MRVAAAGGAAGYAARLARHETALAAAPGRLPSRQDQPKPGGTLRLGFGITQIPTLDPAQVNLGIVAGELVSNIFSSLVQFDEQLGLVGDLAETWEVAPDGLQYTFHLRQGLTFHNGDPLVADDIIYTYQRTINPDFASPHANKLALITEATAVDELTVSLTLSAPYAPFLSTACSRGPGRALTPVPKRAIDEMGDEQFGQTPVGCGPYMMVAEGADLSSGFKMTAFDGWYAGRPYVDTIEVTIIPEASSTISALEAGDVDMLDIVQSIGVEQLRGNDEIVLVEVPGTNWYGLTMNYARPPWDNPVARMAVAKAIDRDDLIAKAVFGLGTRGVGAIAPAFGWAYLPPEEVDDKQAFNLDEAKALAEEAGLAGQKPTIMSAAVNTRPQEVIRNQLQEIGLDVQLEQLQQAAWNERWMAKDYDWIINGSVVDADPDDGHWNFFYSEGPWNTQGYVNAEVDAALEGTRTTSDQAERARLFQQAQALTNADVAYAFLYHLPDIAGFYQKVKGYKAIPEMRYFEHVWLDE
jgi:peptide/nickel transport system substrate-binding protein